VFNCKLTQSGILVWGAALGVFVANGIGSSACAQSAHALPQSLVERDLAAARSLAAVSGGAKQFVGAFDAYLAAASREARSIALERAVAAVRAEVGVEASATWLGRAAKLCGEELYVVGDRSAARELLALAAEGELTSDQRADAYRLLGQAAFYDGDAAGAVAPLTKALNEFDSVEGTAHPMTVPCLTLLAMAEHEQGNMRGVVEWKTRLLEVTGQHPELALTPGQRWTATRHLAQAYVSLGEVAAAIRIGSDLMSDPSEYGHQTGQRVGLLLAMSEWNRLSHPDPFDRILFLSPYLHNSRIQSDPQFCVLLATVAQEFLSIKEWATAGELYAAAAEAAAGCAIAAGDVEGVSAESMSEQALVMRSLAATSYIGGKLPMLAAEQLRSAMWATRIGSEEHERLAEELEETLELSRLLALGDYPQFEVQIIAE